MTNVNSGNNDSVDGAEEYRGAHRIADDHEAAAGAGAAGAGAAGAGSTAAAAGGLPKRGLGMILIAVAAILLLWGIYALTQKAPDGGETGAAGAPTSTSAAPGSAGTSGSAGASGASGVPSSPAAPGAPGAPAAPSAPSAPSAQPAPAPAGGAQGGASTSGNGLTRENAEVLVFNNSPTPDLAGQTAGKLAPDYRVANQSADAARMNLPEQTFGIFPETYVFYDPSVAGAEQVAADVAQRVGGSPRSVRDLPEGASLPREVSDNRNAVTVVLAG